MRHGIFLLLVAGALVGMSACDSGGSEGGGFSLLQFLEAGKSDIPRNRTLVFRFSSPVEADQDFPERLKISNVQRGGGSSDFSRAIGVYVVDAERVTFIPRLPERPDRSDAGLRENGEYHVYLKTGPDALQSTTGDSIVQQQDFVFETNEFFEDPIPDEPPRALVLLARDPLTDATTELSRCEADAFALSQVDSSELLAAGAAIDPGAGGPPQYDTPWSIELHVTEPIDPQTVNTSNIRLTQIRSNALQGDTSADPGHLGDEVNFPVPIAVEAVQDCDECGVQTIFVRVTPLQVLVDDARYRLEFSGNVLGIDYRKQFIGANGLTGDGSVHSALPQPDPLPDEVGGLGYIADFLVHDRAAIFSSRTLSYNTLEDGIEPERGQTAFDERKFNSAVYDSSQNPGRAVGFLSAFGDGDDQDFSVSGGLTKVLDTGAEPNDFLGNPFQVQDMDPDDEYPNSGAIEREKAPTLDFDSVLHSEWEFTSLTVGSGSTLQITGVNPARLRVSGVVQVAGVIDASGGDGQVGGTAGSAGPGGFKGGRGKTGVSGYGSSSYGSCDSSFDTWKNSLPAVKNGYPFSLHGEGPGRGYAGGDVGNWYYYYDTDFGSTGGGGGGHAIRGEDGEDRLNASTETGVGTACGQYGTPYSLTKQLRGGGGYAFGDREIHAITAGGPGGGAGGAVHLRYSYYHSPAAGGGGGGGGGSVEIVASGPILATGGFFDVSGGAGGKGNYIPSSYTYYTSAVMSGGGGGGAGGALSLISGDTINLAGAVLDARGGAGGARPNVGTTDTGCKSCNGGGDGGKGYLFLMDADGIVDGLIQSQPGDYDVSAGLLTIRSFDGARFQAVSAITELFQMPAADPDYLPLEAADVVGIVSPGQTIHVYASSARTSRQDPREPDLTTEQAFDAMIPIARVAYAGGGASVETLPNGTGTNLDLLNPTGSPNRDAFVRIRADFEYTNPVEAALGPFAMMDEITLRFSFNGD